MTDAAEIPEGTQKWDNSVMTVNVEREVIIDHITRNIQRHLPQARPHNPNVQKVAIVGGGWSLNDPKVYAELVALYQQGTPFVALNGAASWLMERNLKPSMQVMLDARMDNVQFVETPISNCKYFIASQCHPAVFDKLEGRNVTIYHATTEDSDIERQILDDYYLGRWTKVHSASCVGVVSILLLRVLGFQFQHLFGMDSCYPPDGSYHHAYPQSLNDNEGSGDFWCSGRKFHCSAWQAAQATSFFNLVRQMGDKFFLSIHGDGLLKHMLQTGANLAKTKE